MTTAQALDFTAERVLPRDARKATVVARVATADCPSLCRIAGDDVIDVTAAFPTLAHLLRREAPAAALSDAQGVTLCDVATLIGLAKNRPEDIGTQGFLDAYARTRSRDIHARARVIDLYNRLCRSDAPPAQALRSLGLKMVHDIAPLRQGVMRAGLGPAT